MKLPHPALILTATAALLLSGCDRSASQAETQRLAEERATLEREKAALAAERTTAREAAIEQERLRLEAQRAELDREKNKLTTERAAQEAAERQARVAVEREARMAAERRAEEEEGKRREAEARERDTPDERETQTVDFFYDALDPYGEWIEIDRYGYAFRPNTNQTALWRPYTDGGWVHTEYGWTWRSNEPFGWATYHYGRWAKLPRLGWVWIPGTEWGPAWVSWRRSSDYVGWAPLPPDAWSSKGFNAGVDSYFDIGPGLYTFLRVADFGEPTYVGHVIEPERNVTIINNTVNITKTVYKVVNNKTTIVNEGPDITVINKAARRPVQQLKVQRVNAAGPQSAKVEGGTLQVVAPNLKKPAGPTKPRQIKGNVKAADMDHGWKEAKADSQKVRDEAAKEARGAEAAERNEPKPAPAARPIPEAGSGLARPVRPGKPQLPPQMQPRPGVEPSINSPNKPGAPAPVAPPKNRPGKPIRPDVPIPQPGTSPAVPPAPEPPPVPTPGVENPARPIPDAPGAATPGRGQRPERQRPSLRQFRQQNASPTPVAPGAGPVERNLRPGRNLKKDPAQES